MRPLMRIMVPVLAVPVFLAFQIASPVHVLCGFGSCIITPDQLASVACAMECTPDTPDPEPAGCCGLDRQVEENCGGCRRAADPETPSCSPRLPSPVTCSAPDWNCGKPDQKPRCKRMPCRACIPERYVADPVIEISIREFPTPDFPIAFATSALIKTDHERSLLHTHSPPIPVPVHSGSEICIEKCSFLL
jgi:hypothetical protein